MTEDKHTSVAIIEKGELPEKLHPVVAAAMQHDQDPETLGKLLDLQERWEKGEAKKAYSAALVGLKRDLPTVIGKDASVDYTGSKGRVHYKHASFAAVVNAITEPLTQHGFSVAWPPSTGQNGVSVTCRLTHTAGHSEEATLSAPADTSGNKNPAQAIASTTTLLSRYLVLSLLGIATADMKDPEGEPDPDHVDAKLNMKAAKAMKDAGYTKEETENLIGRTVQQWTATDLEKLRETLRAIEKAKKAKPAEKPAEETTSSVAPESGHAGAVAGSSEPQASGATEPPHDSETGEVTEGTICAQPGCDSPATHGVYCGGHLPSQKGQGTLDMREPGEEG